MTVAAIVQARLGSSRLPAKILLPLPTGRTVLEEVLYRCKQIPGVDVVVCAIPDSAENDIVAAHVDPRVAEIIRGPEHDVLARYVKAAEAVKADVIMRITADCPLIDPDVCGKVLVYVKSGSYNYVSNAWPTRSFAHGLDCEAFSYRLLREANLMAETPEQREHVTPWMQRFDPRIRAATFRCWDIDWQDKSNLRWTLDTLEDYVHIYSVFEQQMREAA